MRLFKFSMVALGMLASAHAFAGGKVQLKMVEDLTHDETRFELGLPVVEAVKPGITYVSWTGYSCLPETPAANYLKTEQGVELAASDKVTVGLGGTLVYKPELKKLDKSVQGSVSVKLW